MFPNQFFSLNITVSSLKPDKFQSSFAGTKSLYRGEKNCLGNFFQSPSVFFISIYSQVGIAIILKNILKTENCLKIKIFPFKFN